LRRRVLLTLATLLLVSVSLLAAQSTIRKHTEIFDFVNGLRLNGSTTITGASGTGDSAVVLPANSIGPSELTGLVRSLIFCGDDAGTTTTNYLGPALDSAYDGKHTDSSIGGTYCKTLDSTTEATADAPVSTLAVKALGLRCISTATQGSGESITFTLRTGAADTVPVVSCTIGVSATECRTNTATTTNIAAGATMAVKVVPSGNNAAADAWCVTTLVWP
jgi:hypothetical protein